MRTHAQIPLKTVKRNPKTVFRENGARNLRTRNGQMVTWRVWPISNKNFGKTVSQPINVELKRFGSIKGTYPALILIDFEPW